MLKLSKLLHICSSDVCNEVQQCLPLPVDDKKMYHMVRLTSMICIA